MVDNTSIADNKPFSNDPATGKGVVKDASSDTRRQDNNPQPTSSDDSYTTGKNGMFSSDPGDDSHVNA